MLERFEILKNLRISCILQDIPAVIMENGIATEDISFFYHLHASGLINKPYAYDELKGKCHKAFDY